MVQRIAHADGSGPMPGALTPRGVDHLELLVGNALQAAYFLTHALGFRPIAYRGLETGSRDVAAHVLAQGSIRLVVTSALRSSSPVAEHHRRHGDGIRDIALVVDDAERTHAEAVRRGATSVTAPHAVEDEHGRVVLATIATFGDTVHTLVQRDGYDGPFLPGFAAVDDPAPDAGLLTRIDHVVGNVERGALEPWVGFYGRVLGLVELARFSDEQISTEHSALRSKVVGDRTGAVKLPINEPADGTRRSQIDEYLEFHEGPGAQHVAVATDDIVATVAELRRRGVAFLSIPDAYYDELPARVPEAAAELEGLRAQGILVDRDDEGHLLQVFTKPLGDRPTLFLEIIERRGARGFGDGNFKALFEAIEREQAVRGNLERG